MNIVVSINTNYVKPLCVMLRSLLDQNPDTEFTVYVIHSSLTQEHFDYIKQIVGKGNFYLQEIGVPADFMSDAPVLFHFTKEMYYRIFCAKLLPLEAEKALYLDPDMVIINPIHSLYDIDMGKNYFAAAQAVNSVTQMEFKKRLNMPEDSNYFNSGVLLMNLKELRRTQDLQKPLEFIRRMGEKLYLPDQDVLNALYYDKTILLDPLIYNYDARYYNAMRVRSLGKVDMAWIKKNTVIVHFCGKSKPWNEVYLGELGIFYREVAGKLFPKTEKKPLLD